ncbi:MAG: NAD(P)-dependent oxidoreductase [Rhodospirillales bacterium]|nr:NAD(P)-dependent oxidoreductase [Rhodospirillales bacterium]
MTETTKSIRLHIQNPPTPETAPPGYPVRKMNPAFVISGRWFDEACARNPDVAQRLEPTFGETPDEFDAAMKDAEVVIATTQVLKERFPLSAPAPHLRWVMVTSASYHKLVPIDWLPDGVPLVHNLGPHAKKAGEFIATSLLMLNCRIPFFITAKEEKRWAPLVTSGIEGKTLAVIGVGKLGGAGAERARDLGLRVVGIRRGGEPHPLCDEVYGPDGFERVLPDADFVLVTVPFTPETEGYFDRRAFAMMKKDAGFITTAPTRVFDYEALAEGLGSGHLSGAVLDGFDPEPVPPESLLWTTPNLIMTPHTSCIDAEDYTPRTLDLLFENLRADMAGKPLPTLANIERGY